MATIDIPFAFGSRVWAAEGDDAPVRLPCPDCLGSGTVKMVLGNGAEHTLACGTCSHGYDGPCGYVTRNDVVFTPKEITLIRVTSVSPVEYTDAPEGASCYRVYKADKLFADRDACVVVCAELQAKHNAHEEELLVARLASKRKDAAWSVHYWRRKVEECKRDLAAAERVLSALPITTS